MIYAPPTLKTLAWASGRVLMSNPAANVPSQGSPPFNTSAVFFINERIKRSTFHYFNVTVKLQGQQYLNLYCSKIYFKVFYQLKSQEAFGKFIMML